MSQKFVIPVTPGKPVNQQLPGLAPIQAVDIANGTPFDLDYMGLGSADITVIPAGTMNRFYAKTFYSGVANILPLNNNNVQGTGVVNLVAYYMTENLPPGTFPITIPTQVVQATVSNVQTLSNESSSLGAEIIDIGTVNNSRLWDIFNNRFTISIEIGGVKHTILQGSLTGNPLQLGQSGDIAEFLGSVNIDTALTIFGAGTGLEVKNNELVDGQLTVSGSPALLAGTGGTNVNGTSGNYTWKTAIWGPDLKILTIGFANYINNVGTNFTLPSNFARGMFYCGGLGDATNTIQLKLNGVVTNVEVITGFGSGTGGGTTANNVASIFRNTFGNVPASLNQVFVGTTTGAANGSFIMIGS